MLYKDESEIFATQAIISNEDSLELADTQLLREKTLGHLVDTIILTHSRHLRKFCYWVAYFCASELGIIPASIQTLYQAMGRGDINHFTVPAINLRTLTFDLSRAALRSAKKMNAGALIFEIAKSEIGYTHQEPLEYSSLVLLAAIKEDYRGAIFFQGDHFQPNASEYLKDPASETYRLETLIKKAIDGHFYNIDIDTSTFVDISLETLDAQQKLNYQLCGYFTNFIRQNQPPGIEISIGGEIGEVGGKNSTVEELEAFMTGYLKQIGSQKGISKISIQTGTSHGGVVLPDGSIAEANIDFETLAKLSNIGKTRYGMAGAVQHGASTLPNEAFHHFPQSQCAEIHLATQFQNIVYDYMPLPLKEKIYSWLHKECLDEKKNGWTDDQFIYRTRKKALGPFKKEIHCLPPETRQRMALAMEEEFTFLFQQLNIADTRQHVERYVKPIIVPKTKEDFLKEAVDEEG
jgi:fructose/tagatose bisphosphate aldolase